MIDITIIGGGSAARACSDLLSVAGFGLRRTFEFDDEDRSPIILGEIPAALTIARQAVESGRHLLIANPLQFSPERLGLLYEGRRKAQSLFLWSSRRFQPSYRFVSGLIESDPTWHPRYLRHQTLLTEAPSMGLANWTLAEAAALVTGLANDEPISVASSAASNAMRNANELVNLTIDFPHTTAFLQAGLGEAVERRETLIAGTGRKAFIDELSLTAPVRLITEDPRADATNTARWLSAASPAADGPTRQQCLAFLDATLNPELSHEEARLWTLAFAVLVAGRQSLASLGAHARVEGRESQAPGFRLLPSTA